MTLRILESAQEDLLRGYLFYEEQQSGVGTYFLDSLIAEIDSLVLYGGVHAIRNGYHRMLSEKFPFAVYYRIDNNEAVIRAVLDCRQDPEVVEKQLS